MAGNWLYLSTDVQDEKFRLWRHDPNVPTQGWTEVTIDGISDPDSTALGSHKGYLYVATRAQDSSPHLWRLENPGQGIWKQVGPSGLGSAEIITVLSSFGEHLYLGIASGGDSGGLVQLWRSTETGTNNPEITSNTWERIGESTSALISSAFQEFDARLYLGIENTANSQNKAEVWRLDSSSASNSFYRYNAFGWMESNLSIPALAVCDQVLYAVARNGKGAQVWSLLKGGAEFSRTSSWNGFIDPSRSLPLSMVSLGSYLFLSFDTNGKGEVFRLWYDPGNLEQREKQWGAVTINDPNTGKSLFTDASNRLRWLYADPNNGYLFLGTQDSGGRFKLWKSSRLPIITLTSPQMYQTHPYAYFGAFQSKVQVGWRSTRSGEYVIRQVQLKDPNSRISQDPGFVINKSNAEKLTTYTTQPLPPDDRQGTYIAEIAWNKAGDQERYPVLFSFIYDTDKPEQLPVVTSVESGSKKLRVKWAKAHDKLSGIAQYRVWWKQVPVGSDANTGTFSGQSDLLDGSKYEHDISGLMNGRRYAVAVSARDTAGNESDPSDITDLSFGTPQMGRGLTDLVGETGGCFVKNLQGKFIRQFSEAEKSR